ncbi:IS3 family transposase, partial [Alicyclobacillus hesperidum]
MRYQFIHRHRSKFSVEKMCKILGVSRSWYYAWLRRPESERSKRRKRITKRVHQIFVKSHRLYGSPKITQILRHEGERVAQKTVANIMRENGL